VLKLRGLKTFVLIEIQLNVVSVKFKEVTGPFVRSAESKGVRNDLSTGRCEKTAAGGVGIP
jgi:hypothetical protein